MKTCKMGCGKMKSGGTIKKVKKMAKGGQALNKAHGYAKAAMGGTNTEMGIYGVPNAGSTGPNREGINTMKKGGAMKKMSRGGALKPVPADKVGLSKLPTPVRNKMGYMKKGGSKKR